MYKEDVDIILSEGSEIISLGLSRIINIGLKTGFRLILCKDKDKLKQFLLYDRKQILIGKPEVLDDYNMRDYPVLKRVSIIYSFYDSHRLENYDANIKINDSEFKITEIFTKLIKGEFNSQTNQNENILTVREIEVLQLLVSGLSTKEISTKLYISVHTVNNHRKNIIKKLGISTIAGLTIYAVINKIIDPNKILDSL